MSEVMAFLARRRVTLGFAAAAAGVVMAQPTWESWRFGLAVVTAGEVVRIWAAGHLEKGREVTRSGPYRLTRHPLYVGSCILAIGVAIASRSMVFAALIALYMGATIVAAIRTEEALLRQRFGEIYDRYARSDATPMVRRFSMVRVARNREYRAVLGVSAGFALLALKIMLSL
jgi:protein-S-isoprenylcysteine O-methyltransferase Ste14